MTKYRKKPVVIEAYQFPYRDNPNSLDLTGTDTPDWLWDGFVNGVIRAVYHTTADAAPFEGKGYWYLMISTIEGDMACMADSWIIRGIQGELYPCKPDIFEATYEKVYEPKSRCQVHQWDGEIGSCGCE